MLGLTMNSLSMSATTQRNDNFTIPSQSFVFSAELTGLSPGVIYYFQLAGGGIQQASKEFLKGLNKKLSPDINVALILQNHYKSRM